LLYSRARQIAKLNPIPTAQTTNTFLSPSPEPTQASLLDAAESALNLGQPEKVRELLYPTIEGWTSNDDKIRGYRLLGEAELAQGHAQLAGPYFERLCFYGPTAENLFLLATAYDAGGNIKNALAKYQELSKWENPPPELDIEFINMRIYDISRALGTPVPTFTPVQ